MRRDPVTDQDWQTAVDAAWGILASEIAVAFGLLPDRGEIDVDRCVDVVRRGRERGTHPSDDAIQLWVGESSDEADREQVYRVVKRACEFVGDADLASVAEFLRSERFA